MDWPSTTEGNPVAALFQRLRHSRLVPVVLGLAFLAAAALKAYELATQALDERGFWSYRPLLMGVVLFEIGFGLWLLTGLHARFTRLVLILTFFVYLEAALYQASTRQPSCQCLGLLSVDPWVMVLFDLVVLGASFSWRPPAARPTVFSQAWLFAGWLGLFAAVGIPTLVNMVQYTPRGVVHYLRQDVRLGKRLPMHAKRATGRELLESIQTATSVKLTVDERLRRYGEPDFGEIQTDNARAWALMELVAQKQPVSARWERVEDGYRLIPSAPLGTATPWLVSATTFLLLIVGPSVLRSGLARGSFRRHGSDLAADGSSDQKSRQS